MIKIVTTQENPPIPSNNYDWSSCRENYELGDKIGYGKTELEAINDLLEKEECYDGFKAGVEFATRWIPVEEELPPIDVPILIKTMDGYYDETMYNGEYFRGRGDWSLQYEDITHWRPIEFK